MMAQSRTESTWEINNYGKYINQFPLNTLKSIRQNERINKKIYRQKMSIIFNENCINEDILPIYTYIYIHIYIYKRVCVCVCVCVYLGSKSLFKHVQLKTVEYFLFWIFKWRRSSPLIISLMSWSRWWRKCPLLPPSAFDHFAGSP